MANCEFMEEPEYPVPRPTPAQIECTLEAMLQYLENMANCAAQQNPPDPSCCDAADHIYEQDFIGCFIM